MDYDDFVVMEKRSLEADNLLKQSDVTILRCFEHGVSVPQNWIDYRIILRRIKMGSGEEIPQTPNYPEGT